MPPNIPVKPTWLSKRLRHPPADLHGNLSGGHPWPLSHLLKRGSTRSGNHAPCLRLGPAALAVAAIFLELVVLAPHGSIPKLFVQPSRQVEPHENRSTIEPASGRYLNAPRRPIEFGRRHAGPRAIVVLAEVSGEIVHGGNCAASQVPGPCGEPIFSARGNDWRFGL